MNPTNIAAFVDELEKIAGVGWDLHGYDISGDELDRRRATAAEKEGEWYQKSREAVGSPPERFLTKKPGLFSRLLGGRPQRTDNPEYATYLDKLREFSKTNPDSPDSYQVRRDHRVSTPFDKQTNYKLNLYTDYDRKNRSGSMAQYTTDEAYSGKPVIRNLSKKDMKKVVTEYQQAMKDYNPSNGPKDPDSASYIAQGHQAFLNKARHLMKDPKVKVMRLEYE